MLTATKPVDVRTYMHKHKPLWNAIAILYTFVGYIGGIALLLPHSWLNVLGAILLTHSLIYSAFLSHEFMHGTIFKSRRMCVLFGRAMLWLNGGCYYGYQALTAQHIAHHVDRVDVFTFDIPAAIQQQPRPIRQTIVALEWLYFPIVSFWSRWQGIAAVWRNPKSRNEQLRVTLIFGIRLVLFTILGLYSPTALLLYFLSYIASIHVLRWIDAFQHTYEAFLPGTTLPKRDRAHEQANTFSNLLSRRYWWLNLLFLNFGYHNAHHAVMKCPWHSLHELDSELFVGDEVQYISIFQQLANYHKFRITRLFAGQGNATDESGSSTFANFYGAVDVSFLTLY